MSLQKKIQKIIDVINNSNIEEIEVSSFWGAQKIRLSKSKSNQQVTVVEKPLSDISTPVSLNHQNNPSTEANISEDNFEDKAEPLKSDLPIKPEDEQKIKVSDEDLEYQKAPLVGTFYLSSKPGEPPFVSVGDKVSKGQTLCIIEAMKIFNEIESDFDGEIVEVLADDESPVEFNQEIFSIKPN